MYHIDPVDGDLVIDGFQNGIGDSPYTGLTDVKNVNITSVPGEASVSFKTSSLTQTPSYSGISVAVNGDGQTLLLSGLTQNVMIEQGQAISLSSSTISKATSATLFYVFGASQQTTTTENISVTTVYGGTTATAIGTTGTATLSTVNMVLGPRGTITKNYMAESSDGIHWIADSNGLVWSDKIVTSGGSGFSSTSSWTYTGNAGNSGLTSLAYPGGVADSSAFGNGFTFFQTVNASGGLDGWLFLWRQGQIDYLKVITGGTTIAAGSFVWNYAWKSSLTLSTLYGSATAYAHEAIISPLAGQGVVFTDAYTMGAFFQNNVGTSFDPTNAATYTFFGGPTGANAGYQILAANDIGQCCSYVGGLVYIGGVKNVVYGWDLKSNSPTPPLIFLPENNIKNIVTAKQSIYIFAGNRARIYISNGSNADIWKKIPDHISGTVQPIFNWGAATYINNQLYFGLFNGVASPAATNLYGGVWGADVNTGSLYLSNQLSDASYAGYCAALLPMTLGEFVGNGFYAGWYDSASSSGVDASVGTPYIAGQSVVVSDLIPIGTAIQPSTPVQFEFKLSMPLLASETVELQVGSSLSDYANNTFTSLGTKSGSGSSTILSDIFSNKIQNQQWLIVKSILTGKASSPSYNRLTELRVKGATAASKNPSEPFAVQ